MNVSAIHKAGGISPPNRNSGTEGTNIVADGDHCLVTPMELLHHRPNTPREYDIVVLGASGYTASIGAEYIAKNSRTDLKWAIAGRSRGKLEALAEKLKAINPDRIQPGIVVVTMEQPSLNGMAGRSTLVINGIGPYHLYSTPVVEACATMGTHYVGFSLETPWVEDMISRYHKTATDNGAIIIPTIALCPSDIVSFLVAKTIHDRHGGVGAGEVNSTAKLEIQGMSGGSLNTVLSLIQTYGIGWILFGNPWSLSATSQRRKPNPAPLLSRIFGYRSIPGFGDVTTSLSPSATSPSPTAAPPSCPKSTAQISTSMTSGKGPDLATAAGSEREEFLAIGAPSKSNGAQVSARYVYEGSLYYCSALMGVEAALSILGEKTYAHEIGGGILTPATLGLPFIERLRSAGLKIEVEA
ncbi:hypothetical protein V498_01966 [Pseudogymnoascus sp. VKM F-4517 (FW-2822)]|nr:hypothetical protein V498_01966 [Pseudogymnoascus sp. VKM F-4517 (FW-2822)]